MRRRTADITIVASELQRGQTTANSRFACFFSGKSVIDRLEAGGTWSLTITTDKTADNAKPNTTDSAPSKKSDDVFDLWRGLFDK